MNRQGSQAVFIYANLLVLSLFISSNITVSANVEMILINETPDRTAMTSRSVRLPEAPS